MCGELTFSILYTEQAFRRKPLAITTRNHAFASHTVPEIRYGVFQVASNPDHLPEPWLCQNS